MQKLSILSILLLVVIVQYVNSSQWTKWSQWDKCDCDHTLRRRTRVCQRDRGEQEMCPGSPKQVKRCKFSKKKQEKCEKKMTEDLEKDNDDDHDEEEEHDAPDYDDDGNEMKQSRKTKIVVCKDKFKACHKLKKFCGKNPAVNKRCKKTCRVCVDDEDDDENCEDRKKGMFCKVIKAKGKCSSNRYRKAIMKYCKKTCGKCSQGSGGPPCARDNGGCKHKCTPVNGEPVCSCKAGYKLGADKQSCYTGSAKWTEWKKSTCSRTCGTGVLMNMRECKKIGYCAFSSSKECFCVGKKQKMEKCQMKPCVKQAAGKCDDGVLGTAACLNYKAQGQCPAMKTICRKSCGVCKEAETCGDPQARKDKNDGSIVGGQEAFKGYWPWQVAIEKAPINDDVYATDCGGTLIDKKRVVSAAHCFLSNEHKYRVTLGEHNRDENEGSEQVIDVEWIQNHEDYEEGVDQNDIAILFLKEEAKYTKWVQPACMPEKNEEMEVGSECWVTGWGATYVGSGMHNQLMEVMMKTVGHEKCKQRQKYEVTHEMLCVGFDDGMTMASSCHGDSGGPLSCKDPKTGKWKQQGVVSWGSTTCDGLMQYSVFTKVSKYLDWIDKF